MNLKADNNYLPIFVFATAILLFLLPYLSPIANLISRNNDLSFFGQRALYLKQQLLENHHLPLWQDQFFAGSPFLGDPQNPLLYIPNYLAVILPLSVFYPIFFSAHLLLGAIGMYFLTKDLSFKSTAGIFVALIYILTPKFAAHLEAGHMALLAAYCWFPPFVFAFRRLLRKPTFFMAILTAFAASSIFFNYITVFAFVVLVGLVMLVRYYNFLRIAHIKYFALMLLTFLLITMPQLITGAMVFSRIIRTRITLADIGPNVVSFRHFLHQLLFPYSYGLEKLQTEQILFLGVVPTIAAVLGFLFIKRRYQIAVIVLFVPLVIFVMGTKLSIFTYLVTHLPLISLLRIPTRIWFMAIFVIALLSGFALQKLVKKKELQILLIIIVAAELIFFNNLFRISHQELIKPDPIINKVMQKSTQEADYYRLYCTTGCLPDVHAYGKGLVNGYNPVMLDTFFTTAQKAGGYQFGEYALGIPPYQTLADQPQPNSQALGDLGVRFVISTYPLTDLGFIFLDQTGPFLRYHNKSEKPRAYLLDAENTITTVTLETDLPGLLKINLNNQTGKLITNEIYTPYWQAKTDVGEKLSVEEHEETFVSTTIDKPAHSIILAFRPPFMYPLIFLSWLTSGGAIAFVVARSRKLV
ncbi:hypothetical protein C4579_04070 [Candidatus Microgenomates bacterium]|nr:MAG: hypothetical protein C4579_04070 [Candidatus Microgenomates bacterium]